MSETPGLRIVSLTDEELIRLLTVEADQYRDEVLDMARAEAARRGLIIGDERPEASPSGANIGTALRAFGQGVATAFAPGRYTAAGKVVLCPHCGHDCFESQPAVVSTRGLTLFGLAWLNQGATVLACARCGLVQWFRTPPEHTSE
ncbi:MAG TPA: hypothetical protein PLS53_07900 [Thermoanaerobaculaceae bacterium]|nr:hypothetical protein [Thermoanaerobaculaceae bacterium]HPS78060.1 hypothetical protein [Thermoanaerobaculaceae bacterium]